MKTLSETTNLRLANLSPESVFEWIIKSQWTLEQFNAYIVALKKKHEWIGAWTLNNEITKQTE